jgi:hypothetical protein
MEIPKTMTSSRGIQQRPWFPLSALEKTMHTVTKPRTANQQAFSVTELMLTVSLFVVFSALSLYVFGFTRDRELIMLRAVVGDFHAWLVEVRGNAARSGPCSVRFVTPPPSGGRILRGDPIATVEPAGCGNTFRAPEDLQFRLNASASPLPSPLVSAGSADGSCPDITFTASGITLLCGSPAPAASIKVFNVAFAAPQPPGATEFPVACAAVADLSGAPLTGQATSFAQPCRLQSFS